MNLWIYLAIIWIGTSTVIADPGWFVQDLPLNGDEGDDLFSNEHLLPVQKSKPKPKPQIPTKKPDSDKHVQPKPIPTTGKKAPVHEAKTEIIEIERENLIPVERIGRRPLQVSAPRAAPQPKTEAAQPPTPRIESNEEDAAPCTKGKDIDCLMEEEGLMLVSKDKKKTQTPSKPLILPNKAAPSHALPVKNKVKDVERKDKVQTKPKDGELDKSALHRRLMKLPNSPAEEEDAILLTREPQLQPLLDGIMEVREDEEELPFQVANDEVEAHGIIARYKRQAATTDTETSGDFAGSFDETQNTTAEPLYEIPISTTFHTPLPSGTELTAALIANICTPL